MWAMSEEERRRQAMNAYALQNNTEPLQVQNIPEQPTVTVSDQPPQRYSVRVTPTVQAEPIQVSTPYSVRNFLADQPQNQIKSPFQSFINYAIGKNQQGDNRSLLSKLWDQGNILDSGRTFRQNTPTNKDSAAQQYLKATFGPLAAPTMRTARTVLGIGQGLSGLYDLATPGEGTSRTSQFLDKAAKSVDEQAKAVGAAPLYNVLAPAQELALYAMSGGGLAAAKAPSAVGTVSKFGKALNIIDKPAEQVSKLGKFGKIVGKGLSTPETIPEAVGTLKYIGEDASKGKDITPQRVALDVATGIAGNIGGEVAQTWLKKLASSGAYKNIAKETDPTKIENILNRTTPSIDKQETAILSNKLVNITDPTEVKNIIENAATPSPKPTITSPITDDVANALAKTNNPEDIKSSVDALFPNLDNATKQNVTTRLSQTTDTNVVKQIAEEANIQNNKVQQEDLQIRQRLANRPENLRTIESGQANTADERLALTGGDRGQAGLMATPDRRAELMAKMRQNIEQQNAPAGSTPTEQIAPTSKIEQPTVSQPAQTDQIIPAEQAAQNITEANQQIIDTHKKGFFRKVKDIIRTQWDPRAEANKIDKEYENILGRKLTTDEKLSEAIRASSNSKNTSAQYINDSELANVAEKYPVGTKAEEQFNLYRILMHDLERRADGRQPITDYPTETLQQWGREIEDTYPGIRNDLISISQGFVRRLQGLAVNGPDAFVSSDEMAKAALKRNGQPYEFYTPTSRVLPEGVARPEVNAKNIGSLSRQQVLQQLDKTGNDVELTFGSLERYSDLVHKQLGQARVARILGQRIENGIGGKFIQTADEFARLKSYKQNLQELKDVSNSLNKTIGKLKVKASMASKETKQATKQATIRAKQLLKQSISDDIDAQAAIDSLSNKDLIDVLKIAAEPDIRNTPNVRRIYNNFAKKSAANARILEDLDYARMDAEALESAENGIRSEIAELATDSTTGKQIIRGLDGEGNKFTMEVPPDLAKLLQGIEWKGGNITKVGRILTASLRLAWTGILNPAFIVKSAIWNAAMVPITSPRGFKIYAPSAIKAGFSAINNSSEFQKMLTRNAANRYGSDFHKLVSDSAVEAISANRNLISRLKFYNPLTPKGFRRSWGALNEAGGKVDQIYRSMAAKAEYDYAINNGATKEQAEKAASEAYSTVLPDYANVSQQIKAIDAWIPYTAASEAGTRTFFRAIKNNPKKNAAILGMYTSLGVGLYAYSMSNDSGKAYYEDMAKSGKLNSLDGYGVLVLPGAHKDRETGQWNGVIKIPVPPELQSINKAIRETAAAVSTEKNIDAGVYARTLFDFMTGGAFKQVKAPTINIISSIASGKNVETGGLIREPNATTGEAITQTLDYVRSQLGTMGKILDDPKNAKKAVIDSFQNMFYGSKGEKESQKYYRYTEEALKEIKLNSNQLDKFNGVISPRTKDLEGRDIKDNSFYSSSQRAQAWLEDITAGDGKLWEVSKRIAQKQKADGKPIDPLFELTGDKLKIVLGLMANPSPGNKEEEAIRQLNPWVKDFNKKRSEYFDTIFGGEATKDYTGVTVPKADKQLQEKITALQNMPKEAKYQFTKDNPDIADYFAAQDAYQRYKRSIMGLPQFDPYPKASPEVQKMMDTYNALPKDNGPIGKTTGKPTSPDRSAWIKNHPNEWAAMNEQWFKQNIYTLQGEAALAIYEGINLSDDAMSDIDKIAKYRAETSDGVQGYQSSSYGGYGRFGYGRSGKSGGSGSNAQTAKEPSQKISTLISGLKPSEIQQPSIINEAPQKVKFKVKLPSGSKGRSYKKIRIQ